MAHLELMPHIQQTHRRRLQAQISEDEARQLQRVGAQFKLDRTETVTWALETLRAYVATNGHAAVIKPESRRYQRCAHDTRPKSRKTKG